MMIKIAGICMVVSLGLFAGINKQELNKLDVGALMVKDISSHEMLYSKDAYKELHPASLTKVMTVLVAMDQGHLNKTVTITKEMMKVEPTIAGYKKGDQIIMEDLIKAAMIQSDNDAAMGIAIAVGGTKEHFIEMMNAKAKKIGMNHTHFMNPCGFDEENHYSTPRDLMKMAEYAIKNKKFNEISKINQYTYYSQNNHKKFFVYTHNRLLNRYEYAVGIKTGYTSKAGACLIARAKKDGKDCLIVMMHAKEDRWKTAKNIFEQVLNS
ncbi:MAG: serine hydrolase [Sulfuricurvum sp.]|nr:serine hydrolase [Sulfuricurvum sp.]